MKTRINAENETVTITVSHEELTYMWIALDMDSYRYKHEQLYCAAQVCGQLSAQLVKNAFKLSEIELARKETNYAKHDAETLSRMR